MMKFEDFPLNNNVLKLWALLVFTVSQLLFTHNAAALSDVEKARQHYQNSKYQKAGKLWKKIGNRKNDNGEAHFRLAELYKNGLGYQKDHVQARNWYRKSAEKNYVQAMHALGALHYRDGDTSVRSIRGAILWWERAAKAGHKTSLLELANVYLEGEERNILSAKQYGRFAALAGEPAGLHIIKRVEEELIKMNILGARRLINIKPDKYTIEVASFLAFYEAWNFVVLNNIRGARIHRNIYSDFVVTLGEFNSSDEAFTRISKLPDSLITLRPRPREIRVIQRELIPSKTTYAENWIYQRDQNKYTITFYSADARLDALDFVDEEGLEQAALYHSKLGQWIVNAGVFNRVDQAQAAIAKLPTHIKEQGPVINSFRAIHNDMMRSRREIAELYARVNKPPKKPKQQAPTKPIKSIPDTQNSQTQQSIASGTRALNSNKTVAEPPIKKEKVVSKRQNKIVRRGKWAFNTSAASTLATYDSSVAEPVTKTAQPSVRVSSEISAELKASELWMFNKTSKPYSLQLVTTSNPDSILSLLKRKRRELGNNVHLFDQQQPRYFYLLYGNFATPEDARSAARRNNFKGAVVISLDSHKYKRCEKYSADPKQKAEYARFCN